MTVEEIFNKLATHMCEGVAYHDEMARAYDYVGFRGLYKCHVYRACDEKHSYLQLSHYYMTHYFKLLQIENVYESKLIPENWYKYTTQAVDGGTKRNTVKELMEKWVKWEESTKKLYEEMHSELNQLNECAASLFIEQYIKEVDDELEYARRKLTMLESIGYDMIEINKWQEHLYKKYTKKLGW